MSEMLKRTPEDTRLAQERHTLSIEIGESGEQVVEKSLRDIQEIEEKVTDRLGLLPGSPEATDATNQALAAIAEDTLEQSDTSPVEKNDVLDDVAIRTAVEIEGGMPVERTPVAILELHGYGTSLDSEVARLAELHPVTSENHEVVPLVIQAIDELSKHPGMSSDTGGLEYIQHSEQTPKDNEQQDGESVEGYAHERTDRSTAEYVEKVLYKNETVVDRSELQRPSYRIAGREVVMRNRQEAPLFDDAEVGVVGADLAPPLPIEIYDSAVDSHVPSDISAGLAYNKRYEITDLADFEGRLVVTNTPEGLVAAACLLAPSEERRRDLAQLEATLARGEYATSESKDYIDGILGAISIDDKGQPLYAYDTDGFALALAALVGDQEAKELVDFRREALRYNEQIRRSVSKESYLRQASESREAGIVPLAPDHMALVHSTTHAVEYDNNGNVVLAPSGQKRDDRYPRASLHFTVNSQVASNNGGSWESGNTLIVANLAKTMEASDKKPYVLDGMDTWFVANPGESLHLPNALLVTARTEGELLDITDQGASFLLKDAYSVEEQAEIVKLAEKYELELSDGQFAETLKEAALRNTMERTGVPLSEQDSPSLNGHGMADQLLARRMHITAAEMGAGWGSHFNYAESNIEREVSNAMEGPFQAKMQLNGTDDGADSTHATAALEMRRWLLVAGYTPARPMTREPDSMLDFGVGMF